MPGDEADLIQRKQQHHKPCQRSHAKPDGLIINRRLSNCSHEPGDAISRIGKIGKGERNQQHDILATKVESDHAD